jgi:hypothetical protein
MAPTLEQFDEIIDRLVKDTASAVHDMYRGALGGHTARAKTEVGREAAHKAVAALLGVTASPMRPSTATSGAGPKANAPGLNTGTPLHPSGVGPRVSVGISSVPEGPVTDNELSALRKCVLAWLPMGAPAQTAPDSRCIAAGRELLPNWGEREAARNALAKVK